MALLGVDKNVTWKKSTTPKKINTTMEFSVGSCLKTWFKLKFNVFEYRWELLELTVKVLYKITSTSRAVLISPIPWKTAIKHWMSSYPKNSLRICLWPKCVRVLKTRKATIKESKLLFSYLEGGTIKYGCVNELKVSCLLHHQGYKTS